MGRLYTYTDVYGVDSMHPPPQLALPDMRPREGHSLNHTGHVHQDARMLPRRVLARRLSPRLPSIRALGQHTRHHRARLPRDCRVVRGTGSRARSRLRNGPPERGGILERLADTVARGIHPRHMRRHSPPTRHSDCARKHSQRSRQLFPLRMATLRGRPQRQGRRVRAVV